MMGVSFYIIVLSPVYVLNGKWLVVVVKRIDRHFISTFYATDQIKSGEILWKKTSS